MFKTKPNLDRKGSEPADDTSLNSLKGMLEPTENTSRSASRSTSRKQKPEIVPLKDRDWRGEKDGEIWWECQWEGMDGIGGSNKKGRRCFDKVRISWRSAVDQNLKLGGSEY